ncbi:MAG: hypothetical protein SF182_14485 [Deltaproteobacteria bacterium]|nr:hypothetical protein [Deltaproteobacteria bacterium]
MAAPLTLHADSAAPQGAAAPCPYAEGGTCCGTCQEKQQEAGAAPAEMGDCPCKRAKAAREAAAKAAAEKAASEKQ